MLYAVGDIHGEAAKLRELLDVHLLPRLTESDTLLFLGDYIGRGQHSREVIETLSALRGQSWQVVFLRGNHEQMMLDAVDSPPPIVREGGSIIRVPVKTALWFTNGGESTLLSYGIELLNSSRDDLQRWASLLPPEHIAFVRETQFEFVTEYYHFVHAGLVPPGQSWQERLTEPDRDPRLWIFNQFFESDADFGRIVVFGHKPQVKTRRPLIYDNKIGLDTGCGLGGALTAAAFDLSLPPVKPFYTALFQVT